MRTAEDNLQAGDRADTGSGLGDYADTMEVVETLDYHDIEGFPVSTVPGHKGRFVFGYAGGVPIVAMQGRVHFYEGYKPQDVVLPIMLMKLMGAKVLFLTNAAGGINRSFNAGDFMLITDQISMSVPSPLIGENIDELGVRFPDMSEVYSRRLRKIIENSAVTAGVSLRRACIFRPPVRSTRPPQRYAHTSALALTRWECPPPLKR